MSLRKSRIRNSFIRRNLRWVGRGLMLGTTLMLLLIGYFWFSTDLPTADHLHARAALGNTRILDRHGQLLYELPDPLSGRQHPIAISEIPIALQQATIAVEDSSFYDNPGVDAHGILRAIWINLSNRAILAGGSTITQQLARNFLLDPALAQQRSFPRKLRETVLAIKLTASYSKNDILTLYLNQTYYGDLSYGVEAAAQHYFGKPVRDLDLAECALLAGLAQAPSQYDPFSNPSAAQARQADVLDAMVHAGFIAADQATQAKNESLQFAAQVSNKNSTTANGQTQQMRAPHFVYYVLTLLSTRFGPDVVARGGLTVTTTLDLELQETAQAILRRQIALLSMPRSGEPDHRVRNGAVVVLDPADGAILTMVGSPNFNDTSIQGQVNATLSQRQPGSAIKPLTYAAALERGWTAASTIWDIPTTFRTRDGQTYAPQNYDRKFNGPLSLREALATSSNVAAVSVLNKIGIPSLIDMAQRLGIRTLSDSSNAGRYGLALTLGGSEVTPLELTAAFGAFANGGRRIEPYAIVSVSDTQDRALSSTGQASCSSGSLVDCQTTEPMQAISPQVAYLISDILSDRYARMRAFGAHSALDIDRPAAAKTGTTSDWRDNWTVGYTPDRVVGVWVGNADGQAMASISGVSGAGPVWHDVMLAAHRGLPPRPFNRPDKIIEITICAEGGMLPSANCPATRRERFIAGSEPRQPDTSHIAINIDAQVGCRAPAGYPADRVITRIFRILPPEAALWQTISSFPQPPSTVCPTNIAITAEAPTLAVENNASQPTLLNKEPLLLAPADGAVFALSPGIPRARQQIELQASASSDNSKVTIVIDGQTVATFNRPPYRAFWHLTPGQHNALIEVIDTHGKRSKSPIVTFMVEGS